MDNSSGTDLGTPPPYTTVAGSRPVQNASSMKGVSYIVFFCIGEGCGAHRIVEFTREDLCEYFDENPLLRRVGGRPIGELFHCEQCSGIEDQDTVSTKNLRELVDSETLDAVEAALGDEIFFFSTGFTTVREQGVFSYGVSSTGTVYYDKKLFTGTVQQVDFATKALVPGDLESFFGFERQEVEEKLHKKEVEAEVALVEDLMEGLKKQAELREAAKEMIDDIEYLKGVIDSFSLSLG